MGWEGRFCGVWGGVLGGDSEPVMMSMERKWIRLSSTQVTSMMASSRAESSDGSQAWIHHPRDTTTRNSPSFPPSGSLPQLRPVASTCSNGQLSVSRHPGWAADHHATHCSSKTSTDSISGRCFLSYRRPHLNHLPSSSGRGCVGILNVPCIALTKEQTWQ